jgi:hypothetical protein
MLACAIGAEAQQRAIPDDARRGYIRHVREALVIVDGNRSRLAPGAAIRDQKNFIIVPAAMPRDGAWADYIEDASGQILRVWLLSAEEQARPKKRAAD